MAKQDTVKDCLDHLRDAIPELKGVLLASIEGLPVAHALSNDLEPNRIAAMTGAALKMGRRIAETTGNGDFNEIGFRGEEDMLFLYSTGSKAMLAVIAPTSSGVGLIHLEARDTANAIRELL
jgi:predicted regulator of Ras-like GTPase activity (Roadblock/LC7/MglB family)